MFENFKLSYIKSIITIIIIVIFIITLWDLIENFIEIDDDMLKSEGVSLKTKPSGKLGFPEEEECDINDEYYNEVKIKTQQCDNCKLYGNMDNSFINIYKQSFL